MLKEVMLSGQYCCRRNVAECVGVSGAYSRFAGNITIECKWVVLESS